MLNKLPYTVLLNELIGVSHSDAFIRPIDKWKAHENTYLETQDAIPHRAFSIFLFNSQNKLFFQRRSVDKKTFPLCWTNSCCSHPNMIQYQGEQMKKEENIRAALHRALHRQLRMDLNKEKFYLVDKILYKALGAEGTRFGEHQVDYVFICKINAVDVPHQLIKQQVCQAEWVAKNDLSGWMKRKQQNGCVFTPWFQKMHHNGLLSKWWDDVAKGNIVDVDTQQELKVRSL